MGNGKLATGTAAVLMLFGIACAGPASTDDSAPDDLTDDTSSNEGALTLQCTAPAELTGEAKNAFERLNRRRTAAGLPCLEHSAEIASAARKHCQYYTQNAGACVAKPHNEVAGCGGFVAERFTERLKASAYTGQAAYEVMAYVANGTKSVDLWIDSVWHRIPFFSPRVKQFGYGTAGTCDTIDFGYGQTPGVYTKPIYYPFDGQTGVLTKFEGRENPEPPKPPKGWPSGYPVTLYAPGVAIDTHTITVDGSPKELPHVFIAPDDATSLGLLYDEFFLYTHEPLAAKTKYRVVMDGHNKKDGTKVHHEWTFTTK